MIIISRLKVKNYFHFQNKIRGMTNPTVIEMVKRGEIREKKIGGRILYDATEIDEAVKEKSIFRYKRRKSGGFNV